MCVYKEKRVSLFKGKRFLLLFAVAVSPVHESIVAQKIKTQNVSQRTKLLKRWRKLKVKWLK